MKFQWNINFKQLIYSALVIFTLTMHVIAQEEENKTPLVEIKPANIGEIELTIWNDPKFRRDFALSYKASSEIEPRAAADEREYLEEILNFISNEKVKDAEKLLLRLQKEKNASALYDFTLANIYFQTDRFEEAASNYQIAIDKFPKYLRAHKNQALIYMRLNQYKKALPGLIKVIELGGGEAKAYGLLGFAYATMDNQLSAESAFRMAVMLDPETTDWKLSLALSLYKQQRYPETISLCKLLIKEDPESERLWLLKANSHIGLNQAMKAAEIYELLDQMKKTDFNSLNMLADIYMNDQLYEIAVDRYIKAMNLEPTKRPNRALRASKLLISKGEMEQTKKLIKNIERIHIDNLEIEDRKDMLKTRARIAVAEGAGDQEAKILEKIVELDPLDGEVLILLGQYNRRMDNNEKAINYFERAASLEKHEADAKVRHAQLLVSMGKYPEAIKLLKRAQTIKPRENIQKYLDQVERVAKNR